MLKDKEKNLIKYSICTFQNSKAEEVQLNARKATEAFCKVIILTQYGEKRGQDIIYSQDEAFNRSFKISKKQNQQCFEYVLGMLIKIILKYEVMNTCYQKNYRGTELSKVLKAKREFLKRNLELLVFYGNSAAHESSPIQITRNSIKITQSILSELLVWLYQDYLKVEIADELAPYIAEYDIFISYRHTDKEWMKVLIQNLEIQGYKLFVDTFQIIGGEKIDQCLRAAIEKSNCAVIVYPKGDASEWLKNEFRWMKEKQERDSSFKIIPVLTEESEAVLDENIAYIDFKNKTYLGAFNELVCAVKGVSPFKNHLNNKAIKKL
jgi:hypothetical protein